MYDKNKKCFVVSFNNNEHGIGGCEGEETYDYYGHDEAKLIAVVETTDPDYPMKYRKEEGKDYGYFHSVDGDMTAVIYVGHPDLPIFVE